MRLEFLLSLSEGFLLVHALLDLHDQLLFISIDESVYLIPDFIVLLLLLVLVLILDDLP